MLGETIDFFRNSRAGRVAPVAALAMVAAGCGGGHKSLETTTVSSAPKNIAECNYSSETHTKSSAENTNKDFCLVAAYPMGETDFPGSGEIGLVDLRIRFQGKLLDCVLPMAVRGDSGDHIDDLNFDIDKCVPAPDKTKH